MVLFGFDAMIGFEKHFFKISLKAYGSRSGESELKLFFFIITESGLKK